MSIDVSKAHSYLRSRTADNFVIFSVHIFYQLYKCFKENQSLFFDIFACLQAKGMRIAVKLSNLEPHSC